MSVEPFLYLFLFLFFGLITFLARWLKGEIEKSGEVDEGSEAYGLFQDRAVPFEEAEAGFHSKERSVSQASSLSSPAGTEKKRRGKSLHPKNLQEMRRGIVLMTVLGPCRALEPPNESLRF